MAFGRYTNIRIQPVVPEISLQEATAAPMQRQQRRDQMNQVLSQLDTDVNRLDQDDPMVREDIDKFDQRTMDVAQRIQESPNDPSLSRELFSLQKDIKSWKTTGKGFEAQQAYEQFSTYKPTYLEAAMKEGYSAKDAEANFNEIATKLKEDKKWGAFNPDTGETIDYRANTVFDIPNHVDSHKFLSEVFNDATGSMFTENGASRIGIDKETGLMQITDYKTSGGNNLEALQGAVDLVNAEIQNPDSELMRSEAYRGGNAEALLLKAESLAKMKSTVKSSTVSKDRFHNMPASKDGKASVQTNAIKKVDLGGRANPFSLPDGSTEGINTEDQVEAYLQTMGIKGQGLTAVNKLTTGLGDLWDGVLSNTNAAGSLMEAAYWATASEGDSGVEQYINKMQAEKAMEEAEGYLAISGYENLSAVNEFKASITDVFSNAPDKLDEEELNVVAEDLAVYYNVDNETIKEMYHEKDGSFEQLIKGQLKDRTSLFNQTYWEWGTDTDSDKEMKREQSKFNWETLNNNNNWYTADGSLINRNEVLEGKEEWEENAVTVTGFGGVGNPTEWPSANRVVVRDSDGVQKVYWVPDNNDVTSAESRAHQAYRNLTNTTRNFGEVSLVLNGEVKSIPWERKQAVDDKGNSTNGFYYKFANAEDSYYDPMEYLDQYLKFSKGK